MVAMHSMNGHSGKPAAPHTTHATPSDAARSSARLAAADSNGAGRDVPAETWRDEVNEDCGSRSGARRRRPRGVGGRRRCPPPPRAGAERQTRRLCSARNQSAIVSYPRHLIDLTNRRRRRKASDRPHGIEWALHFRLVPSVLYDPLIDCTFFFCYQFSFSTNQHVFSFKNFSIANLVLSFFSL